MSTSICTNGRKTPAAFERYPRSPGQDHSATELADPYASRPFAERDCGGTEQHGLHGPAARLVALAGLALILTPRVVGTAITAVDLAAIAAATDKHLGTAAATQKEPPRLFACEFQHEER